MSVLTVASKVGVVCQLIDFPLKRNGNCQVACVCQRFDGSAVIIHADDVSSLRRCSHEMKALNVSMMFEDTAARDGLKQLLNEDLPHVEQLRIETNRVAVGSEDNVFRNYPRFAYILRAANLPRLHTLMAVGTRVELDWPLCGNLRHLHLQLSSDPNTYQIPTLPLSSFLQILRNCPRLETLCVNNYIDVSTPAGTPSFAVLPLTGHTQLKAIWLHDQPHTMSKILSSLVIPSHVNTRISTFVAGNRPTSALRIVMPDDPAKLRLLGRAHGIKVYHTEQFIPLLWAGTLGDTDGRQVELALLPTVRLDNGLGFVGGTPDGMVLHDLIQSLDVFDTCPARLLRVEGNLKHVTLESWLAAFDCFPGLEELEIKDIQDFSMDAIDVVLHALSSRSRIRPEGAACPRLERLRIRGKIGSQYGRLPPVTILLLKRARLCTPRLRLLELHLHTDSAWDANSVALNLQQLFAPTAEKVNLKIHEKKDRQ